MAIWKRTLEALEVNPLFWTGKKVFITGHTGFKGSWLSLWLQKVGAEVTGYALSPPTNPSLFEVAKVAQGMTSIFAEIRDGLLLKNALLRASPEIVIHMAAQPLVRRSYSDPVETYSTNIMGTVYLLEAIRQTLSVRVLVNVTTDKCYDNKEWAWGYRENDALGGFDPYSSSKACVELISSAYRNSFFKFQKSSEHHVSIATARAGNVIGGGDWAEDRIIPDILRAISEGRSVSVRNPNAIRPWQHVLESINGYLLLAERLFTEGAKFSEAFNFGPDVKDSKSVQWIVDQFIKKWGNNTTWHLDSNANSHESYKLMLDCSKAYSILGWRPIWNIDQSLNAVVDWHKAHYQNQDMKYFCFQQIDEYSTTMCN
jgi:CDP-glucose 4,6-dehydratase